MVQDVEKKAKKADRKPGEKPNDLDPKKWDLIDESKRELLKLLHIWSLLLQKFSTMEEDMQEFAIKEFVGPKTWKKLGV